MKREYKYVILNRSLKTKLGINHYYSVEVSSLCEGDTRYRRVAVKSFNKNSPTALSDACDYLKKMTDIYN